MAPHTLLAIILLAALSLAPEAQAQDRPSTAEEAPREGTLIAYVDDRGRLHVVNSLEMVPQQYRDRARPAKLGETATISSGSEARTKKTRRETSRRRQPARSRGDAAAGREAAGQKRGAKKKARARNKQRLADLQKRRDEVLDEFGLLEEGWLPPDSDENSGSGKPEPSAEQLEMRTESLARQLQELDKQIAELKAKK